MNGTRIYPCLAMATLLAFTACKKEEQTPAQDPQGFQQAQPGGGPYGAGGAVGQPGAQGGAAPYGAAGTAPYAAGGVGGQPAAVGGQPGQQPPPGQVPTLGSVLSDPNSLQNIIAGALAAGAATLSPVTGGELGPIEQGIKMRVKDEAPGMVAEGQLMSARLQPGAHAEGSLTLQPGKCYTILGFGGIGVFDYQLNLITVPPMPPQVLAQSPATGVAPTIGPRDQCIRNPYPLPMTVKVDMHVIRGQGLVGAQAYKK